MSPSRPGSGRALRAVTVALASLLLAPGAGHAAAVPFPMALTEVVSGLDEPTWAGSVPGDETIWVTERKGRILHVLHGVVTPVLDLTATVGTLPGERGLYSIAFHPDFRQNGRLFFNYTDRRRTIRVDEIQVAAGVVVPGTHRSVLVIPQRIAANHNGGQLLFGKDGYLYVSTGDGGGQQDPFANGQNPRSLLGKILRLDVDRGRPYAVPGNNPYAFARGRGRPEIWATGLRNPWRMTIDPPTGDIYVADVGQNRFEEVNWLPWAARMPLLNLGWSAREGRRAFRPQRAMGGRRVDPVYLYRHGPAGCSIAGGVVYRGAAMPAWNGVYVFGDTCSGRFFTLRVRPGRAAAYRTYGRTLPLVVSFGTDGAGELLAVSLNGRIFRLGPRPA